MSDLGLGYDWAKQVNPSVVFASSCLMGQTGPAASFAGYGYHAAALAGFYRGHRLARPAPGGPWSAYTDVVSPRFLATTILAALDRRRRTGHGEHIDISQAEAALTLPRTAVPGLSGQQPHRDSRRQPIGYVRTARHLPLRR